MSLENEAVTRGNSERLRSVKNTALYSALRRAANISVLVRSSYS